MTDVTDADFETAVLARSHEVPVIVDLWATWCGPCRTLGPILEEVVGRTEGRAELAKVDVDANPRTAASFAVQSIPAVYALRDGRVVGHFLGAQPRAFVEQFVDRLIDAGPSFDPDDEASVRAALEADPGDERAVLALAEILVASGRGAEAVELLARVPETADVRRLVALARSGADLDADGAAKEIELLLPAVASDDEARRRVVDLLEVLGPDDERTARYRRALTAALF